MFRNLGKLHLTFKYRGLFRDFHLRTSSCRHFGRVVPSATTRLQNTRLSNSTRLTSSLSCSPTFSTVSLSLHFLSATTLLLSTGTLSPIFTQKMSDLKAQSKNLGENCTEKFEICKTNETHRRHLFLLAMCSQHLDAQHRHRCGHF